LTRPSKLWRSSSTLLEATLRGVPEPAFPQSPYARARAHARARLEVTGNDVAAHYDER
jgi:hypothetical protein